MNKKRVSIIETTINENINILYEIVTNNKDYSWRSDLKNIEIISDTEFIETNLKNNQLKFYIINKKAPSLYSFKIESPVFTALWTGTFFKNNDNSTTICFSEEIEFKNYFYKVISYFLINLKKTQNQYVVDLVNRASKNKVT